MAVPCDCCPVDSPRRCALVATQFATAAETASQAGWTPVSIGATADGVTATTALSGYTTTIGNTPSTTLRVTYTAAASHNRVRGLRLWNQCGGDLNDADGLGNFDAEFYAGASLLATHSFTGLNGGTAQNLLIPSSGELNGVDSVVLRSLSKQIGGSVAPLWRELQLLSIEDVYACRRTNGTVEWYDTGGNQVSTASLVDCTGDPLMPGTPPEPITLPSLRMNGFFFGDDASGTAENLCNVVPTPDSATGWNAPVGGCYDPVPGNPTMTWVNASVVEMTYGDNGNGQSSGAVQINFQYDASNLIQWPTNGAQMTVGEQRWSNFFGGGKRARLTLVSANTTVTVNMLGGATIGVHWNVGGAAQIRFRIEILTL